MGNCVHSPRAQSTAPPPPPPLVPSPYPPPLANPTPTPSPPPPAVHLFGSNACPISWRLRITLLYKGVAFQFTPSDSTPLGRPLLRLAGEESPPESISGDAAKMLAFVDQKFPCPPMSCCNVQETVSPAATASRLSPLAAFQDQDAKPAASFLRAMVVLQHRSLERHCEGLCKKAEAMAQRLSRKGKKGKEKGGYHPAVPESAEGRRLGRWYHEMVEVMLEHARMEEQTIFPGLQRAFHRGVCDKANEQHARHLPLMNGIKEDIKSMLTMDVMAPYFLEALLSLSIRLKTLQERCKEHYEEEERDLLPRLEAVHQVLREDGDAAHKSATGWTAQAMGAMEAAHSHLFPFLMSGLLPQEAMQYLDLVCRCSRNTRELVSVLKLLADALEDAYPHSSVQKNPLKLYEHLLAASP